MAKFWNRMLEIQQPLETEIIAIEALMRNGGVYDKIAQDFLSWRHRQNFITLDSFMAKTGIKRIIDDAVNPKIVTDGKKKALKEIGTGIVTGTAVKTTLDDFLDYAEFLFNILPVAINANYGICNVPLYNAMVQEPSALEYNQIEPSGIINSLLQNLFNALEGLAHKVVTVNGIYRVLARDAVVLELAVKLSENKPKIMDDILFYGHRENCGNLKDKGSILARLHIYFEGELKEQLQANGYKSLVSDIGFIANNVPDIRHSGNSKISAAINKLSIEEKEAWFDKLFTLFLCAIELKEHLAISKDIAEIKKTEANA